jgi:hypothetical protein
MFLVTYKMQMTSGILIFEIDLLITELIDGVACDAKPIKDALCAWWDDPEMPRGTPEEACLGAWATVTDHLVETRQHPRVQCARVAVETSGQKIQFTPTDETWSKLDV